MELLKKARSLRKSQTDVEGIIWRQVRNRQLLGLKFRRQVPIDKYIVDFLCIELKIIVELDGGQHVDATVYDEQRTNLLKKKGFRVVRYWNHEVLENLDEVMDAFTLTLSQRERELKSKQR